MVDSKQCQDKLSQCKIGGPSKPFIDDNLQLQLPNWESQQAQTPSPSPIYSHYMGPSPTSYLSSQIPEAELYQMMAEAEQSYEAWKQMQQKIKEAAQAYQEKTIR